MDITRFTRPSRTSGRNLADVRRPTPAVTAKAARKAAKKADAPATPRPPERNEGDVKPADD